MTQNSNLHVITETTDAWGNMYIADEGNERSLYFNGDSPQSSMWLDAPFDLTIEYTQLLMASLLFIPPPRAALLFGLGGGSVAKFLWNTFPDCEIHSVDIRPKLVEWAYDHFHVPRDPRIHMHIDDAIHFVEEEPQQTFDLIVVDLFTTEGMSSKLADHDFFAQCEKFLSPQGVLAWNVWQSAPKAFLERSIAEMSHAFGKNILLLPSRTEGNHTLIVLPKARNEYKLAGLRARAKSLTTQTRLNFTFLLHAYNNFKTHEF